MKNIYRKALVICFFTSLIGLQSSAQTPVNDNCSGATTIYMSSSVTNCSPVIVNTTHATTASYLSNCWSTSYDDDVWYKFTATEEKVILNISNISVSNATIGYSVFSGDCPNTGVEFTCGASAGGENVIQGLTIGETYYLSVFFTGTSERGTFDICLYRVPFPPPVPVNDSCEGAILLNVASSNCNPITANTISASASMYYSNCFGSANYNDVWYKFIATSNTLDLDISNISLSGYFVGYSVFTGSCPSTGYEFTCGESSGGLTPITGLTIGQMYYISVFIYGANVGGTFDICLHVPFPTPVNDDCSGAISISIASSLTNCNPVTVNTASATTASYFSNCWSSSYDDDVWYKFVATSTTVGLDISNISASGNTIGYSVFPGCPATGTEVTCGSSAGGTSFISGLTPGQTYYLSVFYAGTSDRGTFDICLYSVPPPPANDDCTGAIPISIASSLTNCNPTSVNTLAATPSNFFSNCGSTNTFDDVWYRFTAASASVGLNISNLSIPGAFMGYSVYDGCPGGGNEITCAGAYAGSSLISGLIPGQTYYLVIFYVGTNLGGTFDICLYQPPPPPVNDDCAGAIMINVATSLTNCNPTLVNTTAATTASYLSNCWSTSYDDDVWYKFIATNTYVALNISNISDTTAPIGYSVYDACPGVGNEVTCGISGGGSNSISGLTIGQTYYLSVFYAGTVVRGTFDICLYIPPPPPVNDECTGATSLSIASSLSNCNPVTVNTVTATPSGFLSNCGTTTSFPDLWYKFTPATSSVGLNISNLSIPGAYMGYSVSDGCPGVGNEITCAGVYAGTSLISGLTPGHTYYLVIFYVGANVAGTFDICLYEPPPPPANDDCAGAIPVNVASSLANCNPIMVNTTSATTASYFSNCWSTSYDDDVWYSFVATATDIDFDISNISVPGAAIGYSVFEGMCPGSGSEFTCNITNGGTTLLTGLTVGQTYYISVFYSGMTNRGTFNIYLFLPSPPPANDSCSEAIQIPVVNKWSDCTPITAHTEGATPGNYNSSCWAESYDDVVWYKFTASLTHVYVNMSNKSAAGGHVGYSVLTGCYGNEIACGDDYSGPADLINGLTPGQTYTLAVFYVGTVNRGTFDICLTEDGPAAFVDSLTALGIFPNPTHGNITIRYLTDADNFVIKITDIQGREVYKHPVTSVSGLLDETIDLKYFRKGVYIVQVISDKTLVTAKVVLQ